MSQKELETVSVSIDDITPHPKNVRQGDIGAISESLKAHGQYRAIVVQRSTGHILAGNHTYKAAKALGWQTISAHFIDCDDDAAMRILLADNRANDLATYDDGALAELLTALSHTDDHLTATLFTGDDLDDLLFRLNGDMGAGHNTVSLADGADAYMDKNTRSMVLPYDISTYEKVTEMCSDLRKHHTCETNSDLILLLVTLAHADR
jgi:hypothetical protein